MGTPSSKAVDILKFWEVCLVMVFNFYTDRALQANRTTFPPFSPSRWTTFLFKPPLSLAKGCSVKRWKQIQNGGITSVRSWWRHCKCWNFIIRRSVLISWWVGPLRTGRWKGTRPGGWRFGKGTSTWPGRNSIPNQLDSIIEANKYKD